MIFTTPPGGFSPGPVRGRRSRRADGGAGPQAPSPSLAAAAAAAVTRAAAAAVRRVAALVVKVVLGLRRLGRRGAGSEASEHGRADMAAMCGFGLGYNIRAAGEPAVLRKVSSHAIACQYAL